jgi:intracellular multiplication protein IcmS
MAAVNRQMIAIVKLLDAGFTLNNNPISVEEIFSDNGLLPAIARRADQLCSLCLGYGIGITFEEAQKTLLGVRVTFDDVTPNVLRYFCMTDVVSELINNAANRKAVPLDELMYD